VTTAPLLVRFPDLAALPRVALGRFPTPVVSTAAASRSLWIKRDDLSADPVGGNKVRALEFLLGGVAEGDELVTVGSAGSTHALAAAVYGKRLGARVVVGRWRQEMNAAAEVVARRVTKEAADAPVFASPALAYAWAWIRRARGARWIPAGGSSPLGTLGHVNAALELAAQIQAGVLPQPARVVVPLGTGGTAAGLLLGFAIAGLDATVVGVRVVPRVVARRGAVLRLASRAARLIERLTGERLPRPRAAALDVVHWAYGGAYGRETALGRDAAALLRSATGLVMDATYCAKAAAVALSQPDGDQVLFWLTFDSRSIAPLGMTR
jgi:D-cysteine desulfhydrase